MKKGNTDILEEIKSVYKRMVAVMLDFENPAYLEEDVHSDFIGYGTAKHEFLNTREDLRKMAELQQEQLDEQGFRYDRRFVFEKLFADGNAYMIIEEFLLFLEGNDHEVEVRLSTLLEKIDDKWLITHYHGSTPDSNIAEEEAFPEIGLRKKNQELEEKIRIRTRELEIESSLERIRSQATAMTKSEDLLDVVVTLRNEFINLGHYAQYFWHMMWLPDTYEKAMTSGDGKRIGFVMTLPRHIHGNIPLLAKWERSNEPTVVYAMNVNEAIDYVDLMIRLGNFKNIDPNAPSHDDLRQIGGLTFIMARTTHGEIGYSLPGVVKEPPKEDLEILERFAGAFDLAHRRFLDLKKAEAQTREAQIEAALERVRSKAMAMHDSTHLHETINEFFDQLKYLGIKPIRCGVAQMFHSPPSWQATATNSVDEIDSVELEGVIENLTHPILKGIYENWVNQTDYFPVLKGGDLINYYKILRQDFSVPEFSNGEVHHGHYFNFEQGSIFAWTVSPMTEFEKSIFKRFSNVLSLAYRRYLDLKESEEQTREAQIEAALERVRSRSLAMHKSSELADLSFELVKQVHALGIDTWFCAFNIYDDDSVGSLEWGSNIQGTYEEYRTPREGIFLRYYEAGQSGESLLINEIDEDACPGHYEYLCSLPGVGEQLLQMRDAGIQFPTSQIDHVAFFKYGYIIFITFEPKPEAHDIFKRFAKVFEQSYTRFLDLQKAEQQAREAQINLSVERVRASALAMHKSEEILNVVAKLKDEVMSLDISGVVAATIFLEADTDHIRMWDLSSLERSEQGYLAITDITFRLKKNDPHLYIKRVWENSKDYFVDVQNAKDLDRIIQFMYENNQLEIAKEVEDYTRSTNLKELYTATQKLDKGKLCIDLLEQPTEEMETILNKMGAAFDLAYKRFEDIEKAEQQAREAQIEAALEKVRSRTMAMQSSKELPEAANSLFLEVQALGIPAWSAGYNILSTDKTSSTCIMSSEGEIQMPFILPLTEHESLQPWHKAIIEDKEFFVYGQDGADLVEHYNYMKTLPGLEEVFQQFQDAGIDLPTCQFNHLVKFSEGFLLFITYEAVPEAHSIFKRFGKVFEQTYTRFLDLEKAEEQAREAKIEAALERVRSQSMGMQSTDDFAQVTTEMFNQLRNFGEDLFATGIVFCDKHQGHVEQWHSIPGGGMLTPFIVPIDLDYIHQYRYDQWKLGKNLFSIEIPSDFIEQHFEDIFKLPSAQIALKDLESRNAPMPKAPPWEIDYGASFKHGYILISSLKHFENTDILPRFANVFEQAYTRFLDLQTAETNAYKSKVEAALERVRARALAMQEPDELTEVAHVLRTEMGHLGIEELETCSIYILDKEAHKAECWYALKDARSKEKKLISDHISMDFEKTWVGRQMQNFHESTEETTSIEMKGDQRIEWIRYCEEQSKVFKGYYGEEIPNRTYHLYKFSNGAIGAASASDISEESWGLLKRSASVFSLAYSRFKDLTQAKLDLKRLKAEKKRAEDALSDLQTTQQQLIQSEKMASLGELTAGIAHEIQNPLNFVNNFSEVSKELLEEMQEELANGDIEEARAIMEDIIQNLEKINHHGQRADGIVKGMLQHSRASGDKKEETDINALAEEYLRLAYHGLRAKDKSFNAELISDFDDSIEPINIVPQDIGRVILNLLTNAFYVVNQKRKTGITDFKPTVKISTERLKHSVKISVEDNGSGIPESAREKIFQPFFTTKPTGEGTGLGLSLSYDIITKGHGGNLSVNSETGKGTIFNIELPL